MGALTRREWADLVGLLHAGIIWGGPTMLGEGPVDVDVASGRWISHFSPSRRSKYHRIRCTACRRKDGR